MRCEDEGEREEGGGEAEERSAAGTCRGIRCAGDCLERSPGLLVETAEPGTQSVLPPVTYTAWSIIHKRCICSSFIQLLVHSERHLYATKL